MSRLRVTAAIVGVLAVYLLVHAGGAGYAFYGIHELAVDPVGPSNEYVATARDNYGWFLYIFGTASTLALLSAVSAIGLFRRARWARLCWLITSVVLVVTCLVAVFGYRGKWHMYVFPLVLCVAAWLQLLFARKVPDAR